MRGKWNIENVGQGGNPPCFRYSTRAGDIRLNHSNRATRYQIAATISRVFAFACCQPNGNLATQAMVTIDVLDDQGLLKPIVSKFIEPASDADRVVEVKGAVCVGAKFDFVAGRLPDQLGTRQGAFEAPQSLS